MKTLISTTKVYLNPKCFSLECYGLNLVKQECHVHYKPKLSPEHVPWVPWFLTPVRLFEYSRTGYKKNSTILPQGRLHKKRRTKQIAWKQPPDEPERSDCPAPIVHRFFLPLQQPVPWKQAPLSPMEATVPSRSLIDFFFFFAVLFRSLFPENRFPVSPNEVTVPPRWLIDFSPSSPGACSGAGARFSKDPVT